MRRVIGILQMVGALLAAGVAAMPSAADTVADAVDRSVRPLLAAHDVPGIAVAVTSGGEQRFFAYGATARDGGAPVTRDTLFEIGSVSKTFTATLAAYAEALGRLSLAERPGTYLAALEGTDVGRASLLELGTYTAGGLPLQFPAAVAGEEGMLAWFREWKAGTAPGSRRRYSNPSIGLLGHVTGLAMKRRFPELMEAELLPRLGLARTWIRVPAAETRTYAWGHDRGGRPVRVRPGVLDAEAYGIKSSAADMIRFVEAQIDPAALETALRRAVMATQVGHFAVGPMVQGLGWEQYPYPVPLDRLLAGNSREMAFEPQPAGRLVPPRTPAAPTLFNKTGSTNGFGAYVAFVPQRRVGVVLLANRNLPVPARVAAVHEILQALAP